MYSKGNKIGNIVDRKIGHFTINTIIKCDSFLTLRCPLYLQGSEQFSERGLEMAERYSIIFKKPWLIVPYHLLQDWKKRIYILQLIRLYRIMNIRYNYPTKESSNN